MLVRWSLWSDSWHDGDGRFAGFDDLLSCEIRSPYPVHVVQVQALEESKFLFEAKQKNISKQQAN